MIGLISSMTPRGMRNGKLILRDARTYAVMPVVASVLAERYSIFVVSYRSLHELSNRSHVLQDVAEAVALGWPECGVPRISCCAGDVDV